VSNGDETSIDEQLIDMCGEMRKDCIRMGYAAGKLGAHFGSSLSLIEIMAVLHGNVIKNALFGQSRVFFPDRDRFILSKGHGVMALYAVLKQLGVLSDDELLSFKANGTRLYAHPSINEQIGIEVSTGSLGLGFGIAVGIALALKRRNKLEPMVYVVLGDGECNEGAVWESAMTAAHYGLDNLIVIIDKNGLQYDGPTEEIMSMNALYNQWSAMGWLADEVDGHSVPHIRKSLGNFALTRDSIPKVLIANTIKGKGVSFMENEPRWHHGRLTQDQFNLAMSELDTYR